MPDTRKLAAVMFTDIVGYAALSEQDETLALDLVSEHQKILRQIFPAFGGREIKTTGDGFFCEFSSIVEAVHCAITIQTTLFERNLSASEERKLRIRIGLHLGDVVEVQNDRYGTEVNIAARIEPFAQPGGICISQQVVDQIEGKIDFPIRKLGKLSLKNISHPLAVYRIELPWEPVSLFSLHGFWRGFVRGFMPAGPRTPEGALLGAQIVGVLGILAFVFVKLWYPAHLTVDRGASRSIASGGASEGAPASTAGNPLREIILPNEWRYAVASDSEPGTRWQAFDIYRTNSFADVLDGDYLLKLDFIGAGGFRHPAMALGLISDVHRVYLNGKFIGGSERFADVGIYSFDPELIQPGEINTILIKARTRPSFSPGLNPLPGLSPKIGEFEDVQNEVTSLDFSFHVLRPICFAIALLLAFASLIYYARHRGTLKYLYYCAFLFLGALCLAYYNTFVIASLSYSFYRFIKLLSLGLSSCVLFSSYLNTRGLKRLEAANNFGGVVSGLGAAALLLSQGLHPSQYLTRYNGLFIAIIGYTGAWLGLLVARGLYKASRPVELRAITPVQIANAAMVSGFGVIIGYLCCSSVFDLESFKSLALIYPFAFAVVVLAVGISDYTRKSHDLGQKRRKDDLILSIAHVVATHTDVSMTIAAVQNRVTEFLRARRSTIYLQDPNGEKGALTANYIHGPVGTTGRVKKLIENPSGIIGYCIEHRSPIFVEDIKKDSRFRYLAESREDSSPGFRNGSFMVFPLILGSKLLGVITVADRLDSQPFSREDFCLMHLVAKDLALLLSQPQVQDKLHEQAA